MAPADLRVEDARVVTPGGTVYGGVAAEDGEIVAVGSDRNLPAADRTIDAGGNYLIPGVVEPHVHWGLSRYEYDYHEGLAHDFETETRGAVHGGVTSVVNFLLQPEPYLPDMDLFREVGRENSYIDFAYHAILHKDHHFDEIGGLAEEGIRSFKIFYNWYKHASPELGIEHSDAGRVYRLLDRVADIDVESSPPTVQSPAAMTVLRSGGGDSSTPAVAAYRETVMALPHYEETYGDTPAQSLRAELGSPVGDALADGVELSPPLRDAVVEAARAAARRRAEFDRTLRTEARSLTDARETVSEVASVLRTLADRDRSGSDGRSATLDRQVERCETVSSERQALRRRRLLPDHLEAADLCTYLYREFDWTYPVLSAVTALRACIERLRTGDVG